MATFPPGTCVELRPAERLKLRFPPPDQALTVGVHPSALNAPGNGATLVAEVIDENLTWVGALDEAMLSPTGRVAASPRPIIRSHLLAGPGLWTVVRPGVLVTPNVQAPLYTVYDRDRPWIILGATRAAP